MLSAHLENCWMELLILWHIYIWITAATNKDVGAWLYALPMYSVDLRIDEEIVRVATGFLLNVPHCSPKSCHRYGAPVTHGLNSRRRSPLKTSH